MSTAKTEVESLLRRLPEGCGPEDVQYHLHVLEKVQRGIERADEEGTLSQNAVEERLRRWTDG